MPSFHQKPSFTPNGDRATIAAGGYCVAYIECSKGWIYAPYYNYYVNFRRII